MLGAITFVTAESGRIYDPEDVRAAEDLSHRAVIAIENAQLLASLKDADRRKDEFLAMLAHELGIRSLPIRNAVQIFRAKGRPYRELQWATEVIDRQVHQMTRLVDDLLDVSRITQGQRRAAARRRSSSRRSSSSAVEASRPLIEKWGHQLTRHTSARADQSRCRSRLDSRRCSSNLLNNAAKYTDHGGRIQLSAELEATGRSFE